MQKRKVLHVIIHIAVWLMVFLFPLLLLPKNSDTNLLHFMLHNLVSWTALIIVFYANYLGLIERLFFHKKHLRFALYNLALLVIIAGLSTWLKSMIPDHRPHPEEFSIVSHLMRFFLRDMLSFILTVGLALAIRMTEKWHAIEMEKQEAEHKRSEAELRNLRQQLNPHFLFNTLNNIYALIAISQEKAQEAVLELSNLLRYVLYDNNHTTVPIEKELEFIRNYVALMRLRLTAQTEVTLDIDVQDKQAGIAPLLFISLIENAFKHGVASNSPCFIHISVKQENEMLTARIRNSLFPKTTNDRSGSGIGLANLRRRLEILYPDSHSFHIDTSENIYTTELKIRICP